MRDHSWESEVSLKTIGTDVSRECGTCSIKGLCEHILAFLGDQELLWSIPQVVKGECPALGEVLDQTLTVVQHHVVRAKDVELFWLKTANVIHTACQTVFTLEMSYCNTWSLGERATAPGGQKVGS